MSDKFKAPEQYNPREDRTPLSSRVKVSTKETLAKAAKDAKLALSELAANILDDYAEWLRRQKKK